MDYSFVTDAAFHGLYLGTTVVVLGWVARVVFWGVGKAAEERRSDLWDD